MGLRFTSLCPSSHRIALALAGARRRRCAPRCGTRRGAALFAALLAGAVPLHAATLQVGPGAPYATPSAAINAAHDGDTVLIAPGTYFDCAVIHQNDVTIAGTGADATAVLTDRACAGKAALVIDGHDVTIRNVTLARIRVPDGNGAGIRAEGGSLTVDHVRFINDQDGILAASLPDAVLTVTHSLFQQNGICDPRCGFGIDAGHVRVLRIADSVFAGARGGSHIRSAAAETVLTGDRLDDPGGAMTGPLAWVDGGSIVLTNNVVGLAAGAAPRPGAVLAVGDATALLVRGNTLREPADMQVPLLRNWTGQSAVDEDNHVPTGTLAVSDAGSTYHRLRSRLAAWRDSLRAAAGRAHHIAAVIVHRLL